MRDMRLRDLISVLSKEQVVTIYILDLNLEFRCVHDGIVADVDSSLLDLYVCFVETHPVREDVLFIQL